MSGYDANSLPQDLDEYAKSNTETHPWKFLWSSIPFDYGNWLYLFGKAPSKVGHILLLVSGVLFATLYFAGVLFLGYWKARRTAKQEALTAEEKEREVQNLWNKEYGLKRRVQPTNLDNIGTNVRKGYEESDSSLSSEIFELEQKLEELDKAGVITTASDEETEATTTKKPYKVEDDAKKPQQANTKDKRGKGK